MTRYIDNFVLCINEERYFDAHEALEEVWFPRRFEDDAEMKLIKGFINAAVSFELIKRGRIEPSKKVWKNFEKYRILIGSFESPYQGRYEELSKFLDQKRAQLIKKQ
jgi:Domain of unknown function (DUF309)